jgi:hypothetical protein
MSAFRRPNRMYVFLSLGIASFLIPLFPAGKPAGPPPVSRLAFRSSDARLDRAFEWAKLQAMAYVRTGDPVGDWYEAALPGRAAFCMRDVSHQAAGANALGLAELNKNMLRRFARNISGSKDWCSYWEINSADKPAPVDYRSDKEFWYNLPANFDVLDAIWRQYLWTGDRAFVDDPVFRAFGRRTVEDYVERWALGLDRIMGRPASMNLVRPLDPRNPYLASRGLPSYDEEETPDLNVGADLVAAQYAGYRAYAGLCRARGEAREAEAFLDLAARLKTAFHETWWDAKADGYRALHFTDGRFKTEPSMLEFLLYFGLTAPGRPTGRTLEDLLAIRETNIEARSYFPEIFFRYGRPEEALATILDLCDPGTSRREYPEVSYAVIGALTRGLMGIEPDAEGNSVATWSRLTPSLAWAEVSDVPVLGTRISVKHTGRTETTFRNHGPRAVTWKVCFEGKGRRIGINGAEVPAQVVRTEEGREAICALIPVPPGKSVTASARERAGSRS